MTERRDWEQPPRYQQRDHGQNQQRVSDQGQRGDREPYPPAQPWQPQPYDPVAHKQRISGPQQSRPEQSRPEQSRPAQSRPEQEQRWPQPEYGQHPYPWASPDRQPPGWAPPPPAGERQPYQPATGFPPVPRGGGSSWPGRHKVLTGLIVLVVLVVSGGIVKVAGNIGKPTAATMTAVNSPSCRARLSSWITTGGKERTSVLSADLSALGQASGRLAAGRSPAAIAAVRTAAASVRSGSAAVRADAGPACVPGLRKNLLAAAGDYAQAATDATSGMSQLTAGNHAQAAADAAAASTASRRGNAKLRAATKAATAFSVG